MFSDACKYFTKEGQLIKGPLVGCKIFLVFLIVVSFLNTMGATYSLIKEYSGLKLFICILGVSLHILAILFMRYMCKRCRAITGFIILGIPALSITIFVYLGAMIFLGINPFDKLKNKVKDEDE